VVAALLFHTAVNFWPSVVPVLPTEASYRAYALVVAMLTLLALLASIQRPGQVGTTWRGDLLPSQLDDRYPVPEDRIGSP
jgi:hypothetical protein